MKSNIARRVLVIFCGATLFSCLAPAARPQACSPALTAGKWGFTTSGTVVGIGPRASLGVFTLDASGNLLDGKATASLNGSVTDETFSGTYTVHPDCRGRFAISIFDASGNKILTATVDIVFENNARELRAMFTSAVLPNGAPLPTVITAEAKSLFPLAEWTSPEE